MVREPEAILEAQRSVTLKIEEPKVDADRPWEDDLLNRQEIATRLTNLVANQEAPLTVSLHGQWGTGKTFMLKRWQRDLERQGYRAIYFNAWEDDFCDDPLLAFIGQLSDRFKESGYKALARRVVDVAIPLIKENLNNIVKTKTGITLKVEQFKNRRKTLVDNYNKERATKEELKKALADLSAKVAKDTGHPLIFIVDELDRCRPTFAIELLERVKHIFDVPHIVFVFGINRDELCKSLTSVYGEIDADVYLRRLFDFEFNLSEPDSQKFAESLMGKFDLLMISQRLVNAGVPDFQKEVMDFTNVCPKIWGAMNLSLRDIDYATRLLALLVRNTELGANTHQQLIYPQLVALLIGVRFKDLEMYRSMCSGRFRTGQVIDHLYNGMTQNRNDSELNRYLDQMEGFLFHAEIANLGETDRVEKAMRELQMVVDGPGGYSFEAISKRAQNSVQEGRENIRRAILDAGLTGVNERVLGQLAELIDTYQADLRW